MKRILIITNEYPPLGGGTANEVFFSLKEYTKFTDIFIDVITASHNKIKTEKLTNNITIHFLDIDKKGINIHFQSTKDIIIYTLKAFHFGAKLLKIHKFDYIFCYSGIPAGFIGYVLNLFWKVPYIIRLQGGDVPFYEKRFKLMDILFFQWLSPFIWKRAINTHANSSGLRNMALKVDPKLNIGTIFNGVDINYFTCSDRQKHNDVFIILAVGRLVERKNFDLLIRAVSKLEDKDSIEIQIAGDGPEKQNLKKLAKDLNVNLHLYGETAKRDLVKIYQQADIFCLPSKNEGMSNTLMEAMASGLPCIVSNVGGTSELVNDTNGIVLKINNDEYIIKAIKKLYKNRQLISDKGKKSRRKAEMFSWERTILNYLKIYDFDIDEVVKTN